MNQVWSSSDRVVFTTLMAAIATLIESGHSIADRLDPSALLPSSDRHLIYDVP